MPPIGIPLMGLLSPPGIPADGFGSPLPSPWALLSPVFGFGSIGIPPIGFGSPGFGSPAPMPSFGAGLSPSLGFPPIGLGFGSPPPIGIPAPSPALVLLLSSLVSGLFSGDA